MTEMLEKIARRVDVHLRDAQVLPGDIIWTRPGGPSVLAMHVAREAVEILREPTQDILREAMRSRKVA